MAYHWQLSYCQPHELTLVGFLLGDFVGFFVGCLDGGLVGLVVGDYGSISSRVCHKFKS
jgi:hypothetical protein